MRTQYFGSEEKPFDEEDFEKIIHFMKTDRHVPAKLLDQVVTAQYESSYFFNTAKVLGVVSCALFWNFPVIRTQPGLKRIAFTLLPSYIISHHFHSLGQEMRDKKVYYAYKKFMVFHKKHPKVFV